MSLILKQFKNAIPHKLTLRVAPFVATLSILASVLLTSTLLNKSFEFDAALPSISEPIPPSKSSACCGVGASSTGMVGGAAEGGATAMEVATVGADADLVFNPLNKESPVLGLGHHRRYTATRGRRRGSVRDRGHGRRCRLVIKIQ